MLSIYTYNRVNHIWVLFQVIELNTIKTDSSIKIKMFQYDEKGVENMLLRIAVCDDEAIHRLIIRDKLDAYAISNDIDYELDEFTNSKELMKMENIYDILFFR